MKDYIGKTKVFFFSAVALTLLCVILFTVSMFTAFDADPGYFKSTALLPYVQKALVIVSAVIFAIMALLIPKNTLPSKDPSNVIFTTFASLACGFLIIVGTILFYMTYRHDAEWMQQTIKYIFLAICITGFASAAYFIIGALKSSGEWIGLKTACAVFVIVNLLLMIIFEHLDYFVPINSVRKVLLFISFAVSIMFIAQDLRFMAGLGQPRAYLFFGAVSMLLCSILSIPQIIAHYAGVLRDSSFLIYYLIGIGLSLYTFARLLAYVKYADFVANHGDLEVKECEATEITTNNEEV